MVGVGGMLQLDRLKARLDAAGALPPDFGISEFQLARRIAAEEKKVLDTFLAAINCGVADYVDGDPVFSARNQLYLDYTVESPDGITGVSVKDGKKRGVAWDWGVEFLGGKRGQRALGVFQRRLNPMLRRCG